MDRKLWFGCVFLVTCSVVLALDITAQQFKESPGLYYDHIAEAHLYGTEWKLVTYVNLEIVHDIFRTVRNYARMSADFCKRHEHKCWVNYTGCLNSIRQTDRPMKEVNDLRLILRQLTGNEYETIHTRDKRGVFDFIGGISKMLFGTLDNDDANYYTDKISHLEKEQLDFLNFQKNKLRL